jgi:hypothetical protein
MAVGYWSWDLPDHDATFKKNLLTAMVNNIHVMKEEPKATREWVNHILNLGDNAYKMHLLYNSHPNLFASNSWERIRCWCMNQGALDDPNSKYTRLWFPDESVARKLIEGMKFEPTKKDPNFTLTSKRFW